MATETNSEHEHDEHHSFPDQDMNPVALGCEMIGQDGNSLSSEEARIWASNKGYLFLEGRQIMESCQ